MPFSAAVVTDNNTFAPGPRAHAGFLWTFRLLLVLLAVGGFAIGTPVIRVAVVCALLFSLLGDCDGLVRHVSRFAAFALAIWAAPTLGIPLGDWIGTRTNISFLASRLAGVAAVGVLVLLIARWFGVRLAARTKRVRWLNTADHSLGAVLGAAEGGLLIIGLCWVVNTFDQPLDAMTKQLKQMGGPAAAVAQTLDAAHVAVRDDGAASWLSKWNPLRGMSAVTSVKQFVDVAVDPQRVDALTDDPDFRRVYDLPELQTYLRAFKDDPELRTAVQARNLGAIMQSEVFAKMLNDKALFDALSAHMGDIQAAVARASESPPAAEPPIAATSVDTRAAAARPSRRKSK